MTVSLDPGLPGLGRAVGVAILAPRAFLSRLPIEP